MVTATLGGPGQLLADEDVHAFVRAAGHGARPLRPVPLPGRPRRHAPLPTSASVAGH